MTSVAQPSQSNLSSLLTWENPAQTGKVFGGIVATLIVFKFVNLLNVFFHLSYLGLIAAAAAEYAGKLVTGQGFVTKYKPATKSFAAKLNNEALPLIADFNLKLESEVQKIIYAHDLETTLKAAGVSYILYKLTSWFSLYTLLVTSVILTFTVPAGYFHNKKQIDAAVHKYSECAKAQASELYQKGHKAAAPHFDTLIKKTGPVGSFISSKIPTRTAGSTVGESPAAYANKIDETPSATTTGASKFPEVPQTTASVVDEAEGLKAEVTKATGEVPAPNL
ncbi:reticulon-like protein 1 [[Candida] railenensis]|uniref:Reticulon-like protein n=1 Tax=[Candida] railenensis TaxID=45579 RepID=A0A9P0QLL5_9ASCO|nr:reticulon-like protein 1 [[Candida] railenensis]